MTSGSIELPPHLLAHARTFVDGTNEPVEPRNAASVVLVRDGQAAEVGELEVYFLRRVMGMAFAGGVAVFPGGGVDQRDFAHDGHDQPDGVDDDIRWAGPSQQEWADRLGTDVPLARALVCAAVRETFEESGVLLAGPTEDSVVADTTGADWEADRQALEARELSFSEFLLRRDLLLRSDLLTPWSCWVTPVFEPRRYRTWFFLARLPDGQRTRDVSSESSEVMWLSVRDALLQADRQDLFLLPPQYCTCFELYDVRDCDQAVEVGLGREVALVEPRARFEGDAAHLEVPDRLVRLGAEVLRRLKE